MLILNRVFLVWSIFNLFEFGLTLCRGKLCLAVIFDSISDCRVSVRNNYHKSAIEFNCTLTTRKKKSNKNSDLQISPYYNIYE